MGNVGLFVGGKCCFFPTAVFPWDVVFESCLVTSEGVQINPNKVEAIQKWSAPKTVREV